jgi:hypothetical protein
VDPLGIDFLKDRYDFELERKERLTEALTLPIGVLTVLGSVVGAMAQSFTYKFPILTWIFVPFVVVDILAFAVCLLYLARAYHSQTYIYLPTLKSLYQAKRELREFYEASSMPVEDAVQEFTENLERRIIAAADANTENNDRRSSLLYRSRIVLFLILVLTALAALPFVADQVRK